jgi:hypothetical protein
MKSNTSFVLLFLTLLSFSCALTGCEKQIDKDSLKISYGTSFGFCIGYCKKEISISSNQIKYTKSGWQDSVKTKTCTSPLNDKEWSALVNSIDYKEFDKLEEIIGCPDCADGGAEWIEIKSGAKKHKVTFEYGHEPEAVKEYIATLRGYKDSFNECN